MIEVFFAHLLTFAFLLLIIESCFPIFCNIICLSLTVILFYHLINKCEVAKLGMAAAGIMLPILEPRAFFIEAEMKKATESEKNK